MIKIIKNGTDVSFDDDELNGKANNELAKNQAKDDLITNFIDDDEIDDVMHSIKSFVTARVNDRIRSLKHNGTFFLEGFYFKTGLKPNEIQDEILESELKVTFAEKRSIDIYGRNDTFCILKFNLRGLKFTAIEVPFGMRERKLREMELGKRLLANNNGALGRFPDINFNKKFSDRWIVIETKNRKKADSIEAQTELPPFDMSKPTDIVRECAKLGARPMTMAQNIVLAEIVSDGLGEYCLNYSGTMSDSDINGRKHRKREIEDIESYLGIIFYETVKIDKINYVVRNYGIYKDTKGRLRAFVRGGDGPDGTKAGIFTLSLGRGTNTLGKNIGFRCAL